MVADDNYKKLNIGFISNNIDINKVKEFVLYFKELNKTNASYSFKDMIDKAIDMGLPIPHRNKKGLLFW